MSLEPAGTPWWGSGCIGGAALRSVALAKGMQTIFQDGIAKAFLGETTIEEVLRAAF